MVYWCGHTFLTVPLKLVLLDVRRFIKEHPTEVVVLEIKGDWSPVNADYCFMGNNRSSRLVRMIDHPKEDLNKFIF
jgi:hypothetical protein